MIRSKTNVILIFFGMALGFYMVNQMSCTNDDYDLNEYFPETELPFSETELVASKVNTPPLLDGVIDPAWDDAKKLIGRAVVGDPGNNVFAGYEGTSHEFSLRALYDDENIFILAEWSDNSMDLNRETWYFDPVAKKWLQEKRVPIFNNNGVKTRDAFYEDKFAFLWNVDNTVAGWSASTCFASCHTGLGESKGYARHYTNAPGERIDMWHWKSVRNGIPLGQIDDQYQDETQPNGRKSDSKISGGYTDNIQDFELNGSVVKIPKYFIPDRDYYFWITKDEIDNGTAKLVFSVDEEGVLYYNGGSVNPNTDTDYQRDGSTVGAKGIPSVYLEKWVGSRGDVNVATLFDGSGWVMEIKRSLKTGDTEKQDVDFSSLEDQPFGIGIFNNAAIAHAIKANLILKFDQD